MSKPTLLVTGAGGHLGRKVVETLLDQEAGPIIATTRKPEALADLAARGVAVRRADFDDPASLAAAFSGAERLLLVSTDALDAPGRRLAQHRAAVAAAEAAGVAHVVYLSAPAPHPTPTSSLIGDHYWTEQALAASGLDWTFLRDHIYSEIILVGIGHALETGQLFTATGSGGRSYVSRDDCARTAAAALAGATNGRTILDVTGPAAVTQNEIAALVSALSGRTVTHIPVPAEGLRQGLTAAGLPPLMVDGLVAFDVAAAQGHHAIVTDTVERLTGRKPVSVADFLTAHRAALGTPA
ncbi:NAD(P)H-binding protein [Prosthecomicrobium pneumaticum]|uniref:NAD(P)H dehydrogenase (Quinone) n=1 Tax=Prosthecomicrobium pneumaticum TaxID=81895 RepID=A0A7W9L379_9HYPH|nr:NAD(P)H-binding protein [Prosthecomicrobium pneumaticum]MBB5754283.1 NAD(P)H dehydrogenase (quinone) [Prosthecomicrobium pneumaticum]